MPPRAQRLIASSATALALALAVAGCNTTNGPETTGSVGLSSMASAPSSEADWRSSLDTWGQRYRENPGDPAAAIAYARALRATEQYTQAVAVLEQAAMRNPKSMPLLGAYGRALADTGQYTQALEALDKAHTPEGAAESRARRRTRRPFRRGRAHRARRPAAGAGRRQCQLPAHDAGAAEGLEEAGPHHQAPARRRELKPAARRAD
jgi:Flp pilus assembly protein TadD